MSTSYVCFRCRSSLFRHAPRTVNVVTYPRATFVSLSHKDEVRPETNRKSSKLHRDAADNSNSSALIATARHHGPRSLRSQGRESDQDMIAKQALESLFLETARAAENERKTGQRRQSQASVERSEKVETLRALVDDPNVHPAEAWAFFVEHLGPDVWEDEFEYRPTLYIPTVRKLVRKLLYSPVEIQSSTSPKTPTPRFNEIMSYCAPLNTFLLRDWVVYMWDLLQQFWNISKGTPIATSNEAKVEVTPQQAELQQRLANSIVEAWKYLFEKFSTGQKQAVINPDEVANTWFAFPVNLRQKWRLGSKFPAILQSFLPKYPRNFKSLKSLSQVTLVTFGLLCRFPVRDEIQAQHQHELLSTLAVAIETIQSSDLDGILGRENHALLEECVRIPWPALIEDATTLGSKALNASSDSTQPSMAALSLRKRLQIASENRDKRQAKTLFDTLKRLDRQDVTVGLCNQFLRTFMSMRLPETAIDVWNHMQSLNLEPNVASWNAMFEGCKNAREFELSENLWQKMMLSGIEPDAVLWTTRIHICVECRQWQAALNALNEVSGRWLTAARAQDQKASKAELEAMGDVNGVLKPTIEMVNAAILVYVRTQQVEKAMELIAWAESIGIKADLITYNSLLRPLIRSGRLEEVKLLVGEMAKRGVQPDIVTFTTILDETFRDAAQLTPEEEKETVDMVFSEMKSAGIKPTLHTYGKIIHSLVQSASRDMRFINTVFTRMEAQGLVPSTYIYTILITHCFSQNPPNMAGVKYLFDHIESTGALLDNIFWDRVIEGYCQANDIENALRIYRIQDRAEPRVGWHTLNFLLVALRENNQWVSMRELVAFVLQSRGGPILKEEQGQAGQHTFWQHAAEYGLLP